MGVFVRFLVLLISISVICCSGPIEAFAASPIVHTKDGDVSGVRQGAVESFKKLPYAAPPTGDLRWKPPRDPAPWPGVLHGSHFSEPCPQSPNGFPGKEDCLYLNVFRPKDAQRLPVIVFIHGGHNAIGSAVLIGYGGVPLFDGSDLAQNGNVVVVTINYRLGALGFIAHPKLSKESGHGSGNYGYLDQIQALKWVKRNIAAFGGDPNNVTLVGASSGGGGIEVLMASPLVQEGLFHRAIIHSGQFRTHNLAKAEKIGVSLSEALGCRGPDELKCMRNKRASDIVNAMPGGHGDDGSVSGPLRFLPVVDKWLLPDEPLNVIRRGEHHRVPVLIGNVVEETSWIYADDSKDLHTEEDYKNKVKNNYKTAAAEILSLYPAREYQEFGVDYVDAEGSLRPRITIQPSPRRAYNAISADHWFVCPAQKLARALSGSQSEFVGRFLYTHVLSGAVFFDHDEEEHSLSGTLSINGASHGYDLAFVFGTFRAYEVPSPTPDELILKAKFQKTWADFAKSGRPGDFWDRYNARRGNYVMFNTPMSSGSQLRAKQCTYWDRFDKSAAEVSEDGSGAKPAVVNEAPMPR